jgi:hypothetical protein
VPLEQRATGDDAAVAREDAEDRERRDALPAPGLADDAQRFTWRDVEGDPIDGMDRPPGGAEVNA